MPSPRQVTVPSKPCPNCGGTLYDVEVDEPEGITVPLPVRGGAVCASCGQHPH